MRFGHPSGENIHEETSGPNEETLGLTFSSRVSATCEDVAPVGCNEERRRGCP
jgi:hypothetical protein